MVLGANIRGGLTEIWGHKLRSALTLIGIIFGTLSINFMFSIVQGVRETISDVFDTIGLDGAIFVSPRDLERGERNAWNLASTGIVYADVEALRDKMRGRAMVSPIGTIMRTVENDGKRVAVQIDAVN